MLVSLSSSVCNIWQKRQIHINTDFEVTGWILCVITHIRKDAKYHSDSDHIKQVKSVIKTLFHGVPEDKIAVTKDIFWNEYTDFDDKIVSFDGDGYIWKIKDIRYGNIDLWHQKYSLPFNKVLGFVACRVTLKVIDIVSAEHSWDDVKTFKSGKRFAIISGVSQTHSIVYMSAFIESDKIERYNSCKQRNDNCSSHTWNEGDGDFDKQLEKWGVEKIFSYQSEPVKRNLRAYTENW